MTTGEISSQGHEVEPEAELQTDYAASAEQLFELLTADTAQTERYFRAVWDPEVSTRINDVDIMTAVPTGARRGERFGQFHSAQFDLTEISLTGGKTNRFVWGYTGPRSTGSPIRLDLGTLSREYGYELLKSDNVVRTLATRAKSVDDYITLARTMQRYNAQPIRELVSWVNRQLYHFAYAELPVNPTESGLSGQDKVFELIKEFRAFGSEVPAELQSYLVSQLLRRIVFSEPPQRPVADAAAVTLETALREGVIDDEPRIAHRILTTGPIYRYAFATHLLHERLHSGPERGSAQNIFGMNRAALTHDYIVAVLQTGTQPASGQIGKYLQAKRFGGPEYDAPQRLKGLVSDLSTLVDARAAKHDRGGYVPAAQGMDEVLPVFDHVLAMLRAGESQTPEEADFDRKCLDNVSALLWPPAQRIGRRAVVAAATAATEVEIES